jgi:tetraacyldisaccharide 4'-kinase
MTSERAHWSQRWLHASQRRGLLACALWPVSLVYGALWLLRLALWRMGVWRPVRLPVPVLVVGNVVAGGAGKTPTTMALVHQLRARGFVPGVISRGYGREVAHAVLVQADTPAHLCGDEPALVRRTTGAPVAVASDRALAGQLLLAAHPEIDLLICDDGLQHWRLHREVSLAVFDERGVGNGWLLPAGLLREPWPVRHAWAPDALLQQGAPGAAAVPNPKRLPAFWADKRLNDDAINLLGERRKLGDWAKAQTPVQVVCGIAKPQRFVDMLVACGVQVTDCTALADHAPAAALQAAVAATTGDVLCTEKDAVKLAGDLPHETRARVWAVGLTMTLPSALVDLITERLRGYDR